MKTRTLFLSLSILLSLFLTACGDHPKTYFGTSFPVALDSCCMEFRITGEDEATFESVAPVGDTCSAYGRHDIRIPEEVVFHGRTYRVTAVSANPYIDSHLTAIFPPTVTTVYADLPDNADLSRLESVDCRNSQNETDWDSGIKVLKTSAVGYEGEPASALLELPEGIRYIAADAFASQSFAKVILPKGVLKIEADALPHTVAEMDIPKSLAVILQDMHPTRWYARQPDGLVYAGTTVCGYKGKPTGKIKLKSGTTCIANGAFAGCDISGISIPSSVKHIGANAFAECKSLQKIDIPNSVEHIGEYAFAGCTALTEVKLSKSLTVLNSGTFAGCSALGAIELPDNILAILGNTDGWGAKGAFEDCKLLRQLKLPEKLSYIGRDAFYNCRKLHSVTFPKTVCTVRQQAFAHCSRLWNIKFLDSAVDIDRSAFYSTLWEEDHESEAVVYIDSILMKCDLKDKSGTYKIKEGTQSVAGNAISTTDKLEHLVFPSTIKVLGEADANSGIACTCTLLSQEPPLLNRIWNYFQKDTVKVPAAAIERYKSNSQWHIPGNRQNITFLPL